MGRDNFNAHLCDAQFASYQTTRYQMLGPLQDIPHLFHATHPHRQHASTCPKAFHQYSTLLARLETETCVTTRVELDRLEVECAYWKNFGVPGCEAHLRMGDRKNYISKSLGTMMMKERSMKILEIW